MLSGLAWPTAFLEEAAHESFGDNCFRGCCAVGVQRAAGGELLSRFRISRDRKQRAVFDESAVPTRTTRRHHQRALKLLRASEWQRWHERVDLGAGDVAELRPGENRIVAGGMDSNFAFTALIR